MSGFVICLWLKGEKPQTHEDDKEEDENAKKMISRKFSILLLIVKLQNYMSLNARLYYTPLHAISMSYLKKVPGEDEFYGAHCCRTVQIDEMVYITTKIVTQRRRKLHCHSHVSKNDGLGRVKNNKNRGYTHSTLCDSQINTEEYIP